MNAFSAPALVIRPTLPVDTPDVLEFCKHTWGGDDYVPYVWSDWLADPDGTMFTAEYGGEAVGISRLKFLTEDQWWLEGLRVNPKYEDRGIGRRLNNYSVGHWIEHCSGAVRLLTSSKRVKVHHMCETGGFVRRGEFVGYTAPALDTTGLEYQAVAESETAEASGYIDENISLAPGWGLIDLGWHFITPDRAVLAREILKQQVHWWRGRQGLLTIWEDDDDQGTRYAMIGLAVCQPEDIAAFLHDFRGLASHLGFQQTGWVAPASAKLVEALLKNSFTTDWDDSVYLFEKKHPHRP